MDDGRGGAPAVRRRKLDAPSGGVHATAHRCSARCTRTRASAPCPSPLMLAAADDPRFAAARNGDVERLRALLGTMSDAEVRDARIGPYGWTLLHAAAHGGHLAAVELLLARGCD